jgi:hypothetical protein
MPQAVTSGPFYWYGFVVLFFGVPVAIDVLCHWPSTYRKAGLHKWRWALAALASNLLVVGPVFAVLYLFTAHRRIRATKPVRPANADRSARKRSSIPAHPVGGAGEHHNVSEVECPRCHGNKWFICPRCQGSFRINGPSVNECYCEGGKVRCELCRARGTVRA